MFVWDKCGYFEFSNINFNKNKIVSYLILEICDYYSFILRILFWDSIKYILILSNRMEKPLQSKGKKHGGHLHQKRILILFNLTYKIDNRLNFGNPPMSIFKSIFLNIAPYASFYITRPCHKKHDACCKANFQKTRQPYDFKMGLLLWWNNNIDTNNLLPLFLADVILIKAPYAVNYVMEMHTHKYVNIFKPLHHLFMHTVMCSPITILLIPHFNQM